LAGLDMLHLFMTSKMSVGRLKSEIRQLHSFTVLQTPKPYIVL